MAREVEQYDSAFTHPTACVTEPMTETETEESGISVSERRYKLIIVAPTCFYYQVALFRKLTDHPMFDVTVYFCSDEALKAVDVQKMYKVNAPWGDESELLEGYDYQFLKNYSPDPSYLKWPHGLMNIGIFNEIRKQRPDGVVLMSWLNFTWWTAIAASRIFGVPFYYLTDANIDGEMTGSRKKRWIKRLFLGKIIFKWASGFLCAGTANKKLYEFYNVPENKLMDFAYSWGYESLLDVSSDLRQKKFEIRQELGIPNDKEVILYSGRLSPEKSPFHLLDAYRSMDSTDKALVFVGDGNLRAGMEEYVAEHNLESVYFSGFKDRKEIPKYFAMADVLVLPSRRETWGMVINEALCMGLPVIVSDQVGAGKDLVRDGYNGFLFHHEDPEGLSNALNRFFALPEEQKKGFSDRSVEIISEWVNRDLCHSLGEFLESTQRN